MLQKKPVDPKFQKLFEPGYIGKMWVKNRIVRSPMLTGLATSDGCVTERLVNHYKVFARGGAGLVIVEYSFVDNDASKSAMGQPGVSNIEHQPGLQWLARVIKENGAKAGIQLVHCGRQKFLGTRPLKSAVRIPWPDLYAGGAPVPDELTIEEIEQLINEFGKAALMAKTCGFDMVEVHGAHGYLITNFLSPKNKRSDWYGGSLNNRMRFLIQLVENIRRKVGPDYPLGVRLDGTDYEREDAIPIEETIQVAKALEKAGVNIIHVSGGCHQEMDNEVVTMYWPLAFQAWAADKIKKEIGIPVICSGSITSPELAENILKEGKGDFVGLGRPLIADPYFSIKAQEGRPEDIRPCIRCAECIDKGVGVGHITCTVNATTGREEDLERIVPAEKPKKVAIIGGGPAGMEAGRVAALRGHNVTLFEKRALGGLLIEAAIPEFKADIRPLIKYHITQLEKTGVKVVKEEASAQTIKDGKFDTVIVATGAEPSLPKVPGIHKPSVISALDVLRGTSTGNDVIVVGGGLVGSEVALFLAKQGKKVTIVEMLDHIAQGLSLAMKGAFFKIIENLPVTIYTGLRLEEVTDDGIIASNFATATRNIKGDTVVIATGFKTNLGLWNELSKIPELEVYAIGDCVEVRTSYEAIHEGFHTAFSLM